LQWYAEPKIYHQIMKRNFTMARPAENLPSDNEKKFATARQVENMLSDDEKEFYDGTTG
jgi:hypothetical protein